MIRRADTTVSDSLNTPTPGVYITVRNSAGSVATIYDDAGAVKANPFTSALDGTFSYQVAAAGTYTEEYRLTLGGTPRQTQAVQLGALAESGAVSVLDFGAVGDGVTDDKTAIDLAIATGADVVAPDGYTFLTSGAHLLTTNGQKISGGTFKKKSGTVQSLFVIQDDVSGVRFDGVTFDGNRAAFVAGNGVSGILAYRAPNVAITNCTFTGFIDDAAKLINCPSFVISQCYVSFCTNNGVEVLSYGNDPRTGNAWAGTVAGPSGIINTCAFDAIDDGLMGVGNGCAINCALNAPELPNAESARSIGPISIFACKFDDCLRSVWFERNVTAPRIQNITIVSPQITGNIRGPSVVKTKDGIGLINVERAVVIAPQILNVGNFAPPSGANCAGMQISGANSNSITVTSLRVIDTTGNTNRTQHGAYINAANDVSILDYDIQGVSIGAITQTGSPTNVRIAKLAAKQAAITAPTGGATIDTQARTAVDAIRAALTAHGLTL